MSFKILFVCTGNTCRSPMAQNYFQFLVNQNRVLRSQIIVDSAGISATGDPISKGATEALFYNRIPYRKDRKSQPLTKEIVDSADLIVGIQKSHANLITQRFPEAAEKTIYLDEIVPDPFLQKTEVYLAVLDQMKPKLRELFDTIKKELI